MESLILKCACGATMRVDASALGRNIQCSRCRQITVVARANALTQAEWDVQLFFDEKQPESPPESPVAAPPPSAPQAAERCTRCGRPFRGAWDKHEIALETLCNICANQAANFEVGAVPPKQPPPPSPLLKEIAGQYSWTKLEQARVPKKLTGEEKRKRIRDISIIGLIAAVGMLGIYFWPESLMPGVHHASTPKEAPQSVIYLVMTIQILLAVAAQSLAIFLTLSWANKLPNEAFIANLFVVTVVGAGVYALSYLPIAGTILGFLVVFGLYDLRVREVIMFILFSALARMLAWAVGLLVFGAMDISLP